MTASDDLVVIGEITKPHGIRGEVCVKFYADSPFLLDELERVFMRPGKRAPAPKLPPAKGGKGRRGGKNARAPHPPRMQAVKITKWREHKNMVLMVLDGVPGRNEAELLRGYELLIHEADLPELGEDELYLHAILGLRVLLEDGEDVGVITDALDNSGQEVWVIDAGRGCEILFPVAQEFVKAIDLDAGAVTIAPPPGLLELYLEDDSDNPEAEPGGNNK